MTWIVDQRDHRGNIARRPIARHQFVTRFIGVLGAADELDHGVNIGDRNGKSDEHVGTIARFAEQMFGAAIDYFFAEGDERGQQVLDVHYLRTATLERDHVVADRRVQRSETIQLVEHHIRHRIAPQFDDDTIAMTVGFVAQGADAFDLLIAHQFADALYQMRLVDLVGNFAHDDGFAFAAQGFKLDLAAHDDRAAAQMISGAYTLTAEDNAAGRKIRAGYDRNQVVDRKRRIVDERNAGIDDFTEIVRRNIRRHADGNAASTVDKKIGKARRQDGGLLLHAVVVRLEIDRILVDVFNEGAGDAFEPHFGVTHRRWRIAVDRAEIALPVNERQAQGKILRHANQRVIDGLIAMRVIFTDDVADDARRFTIRLIPLVAVLVHRIEDAAMDRLEPVACVGQGAGHDYAHRVIEIAPLHLFGDRDGANVGRCATLAAVVRRPIILV